MNQAYALLEVKAIEPERRRIRGVASTPELDRQGDVFEPAGATFRNPIPLLFHHDQTQPIGTATLAVTPDGITFEATLPAIAEPGPLKSRVDDAWQCLQAGVISGASLGYRVLSGGVQYLANGARRLTKTEVCELSLVTIPANASATIRLVKSLAAPRRVEKSAMNQTASEHIQNLENKRAAIAARMSDVMKGAADEDRTLNESEATEHDGLAVQVKSIDGDLVRWRELEKMHAVAATRIETSTPAIVRAPVPVVSVKSAAAPGVTFVRSVKALLQAKGDSYRALELGKTYNDPNVELLIKAAVAPGTTTDPAWAGALVTVSNLTNEFIELSRAATILGKVPVRHVPFNTSVPIQTAGGSYKWVGQAKAKPVTKLAFGSASLGMAKAAGIIVLTEELVRSSSPSAEMIVRDDMVKGIAAFLDQQFTDPAVAAVADVSPASITNGAPTAASTNDPEQDLALIVGHHATNNQQLSGVTLIMSESNAYGMGMARGINGDKLFPGVGVNGGNANGLTVVASNTVGALVISVAGQEILLADDGGVSIDVSREASLQMNDAPVNPADPATTSWTSLWQDNLVGLRAERFINWKRATSDAVFYLTAANYLSGGGALAAGTGGSGSSGSGDAKRGHK